MSPPNGEEVLADAKSGSPHFLQEGAKKAGTSTTTKVFDSSEVAQAHATLHLKLVEHLGPSLGTYKSVAAHLKSVNAIYLEEISQKGTILVFTGLTAQAFEQEMEDQLDEAEKAIKYSCPAEKDMAVSRIVSARKGLRNEGWGRELKLGLQHVYDPAIQRGYYAGMVMKFVPAGDGGSKQLMIGHGSIYYEYDTRGSKLCFKPIEMDIKNDAMYWPTLERAALASVGEEIKRIKPNRRKWEAARQEANWIVSLATNAACAIITALNPWKETKFLP